MRDDDQHDAFDAIAAAAELEASLASEPSERTGDPGYLEALEAESAELNALLERTQAALREAEARAERAQAEISRAEERLRRESRREAERWSQELLLGFLEVQDDLDRALEAPAGDGPDTLRTGIELVRRRFARVLERSGVMPQLALGEPFDPARHEAVSTVAVEPSRDGRVLTVVREGFTVGDSVLRPARVLVGRAAP